MHTLLLVYRVEAAILFVACTFVFIVCRHLLLVGTGSGSGSKLAAQSSSSSSSSSSSPSSLPVELGRTNRIRIDTKQRGGGGGENAVYLTRFHSGAWMALALHTAYGFLSYFADPTNIYYLAISVMLIYEYGDARALTHVSVLLCFALVATVNHVRTTGRLLLRQHTINGAPTRRLIVQVGGDLSQDVALVQVSLPHRNLRRGDLVRLEHGCPVPADILLLGGRVSAQELQLTGENIVIGKSAPTGSGSREKKVIEIHAQHHANEGVVQSEGDNSERPCVYTARNMVFRGTDLVDGQGYGVVIETGNDCAIYRLQHDRHRPATAVQKRTMRVCVTNLYLMLLLASCTALMLYDERTEKSSKSGWIVWALLRKMLLLFNTLVPLSHQLFFSEGSRLLSRRIERAIAGVTINRGGLMAFQNDKARIIVTDKTGTVTTDRQDLAAWWRVPNNDVDQMREFVSVCRPEDDCDGLIRDGLHGVIACTDVQPHSVSGELLKSDPLEERLLAFALGRLDARLVANEAKRAEVRFTDQTTVVERVLLLPFSHQLEAKMAVTRYKRPSGDGTQVYSLHVQGTPEAIQRAALRGKVVQRLLDETIAQDDGARPRDAYRRVIAYGRRWLTRAQVDQLESDPAKHAPALLHDLFDVAVYVFHDHAVPGVDHAIRQLTTAAAGHCVVLLTGDKASAAQEIGETIGLLTLPGSVVVDTCAGLRAASASSNKNNNRACLVLDGRLLQERVQCGQTELLRAAIMRGVHGRRIIVFRASPTCKQMLVALLQSWYPDEHVVMVGDGCNDMSALVQADVSVAISHGKDNQGVQDVADVVLDDWCKLVPLLDEFSRKRRMILHVSSWIMQKHFGTAATLLTILLMSDLTHVRDPSHPLAMNAFNASMFVCMYVYCRWGEDDHPPESTTSWRADLFSRRMAAGVVLGVAQAWFVFTYCFDLTTAADSGIHLLIALQAVQLAFQLLRRRRHHCAK